MVTPMGSSQSPGFFTLPLTPKIFVPASAEELRALYHSGPFAEDMGDIAERLHVVDDRRPAPEPAHLREGRLVAGCGAPAFQRVQQAAFLPAHVAAGAQVEAELDVPRGAQHLLPDVFLLPGPLPKPA